MVRGGYELPEISLGPAMPDPSMPCRQATPETASRLFLGQPARRAGGLRLLAIFYPLDTPKPCAHEFLMERATQKVPFLLVRRSH
jgi:hypothetical protein